MIPSLSICRAIDFLVQRAWFWPKRKMICISPIIANHVTSWQDTQSWCYIIFTQAALFYEYPFNWACVQNEANYIYLELNCWIQDGTISSSNLTGNVNTLRPTTIIEQWPHTVHILWEQNLVETYVECIYLLLLDWEKQHEVRWPSGGVLAFLPESWGSIPTW